MRNGSATQTGGLGGQRIDESAVASAHAARASAKPAVIRRFRAAHWLVVCGLLLGAVVVGGTAWVLLDLRDRALVASERELANTALVLAEQTDRAIQAVELMESG